jgi:hypothetical protein
VLALAVQHSAAEALQALLAFLVLYRRLAVVVAEVQDPEREALCTPVCLAVLEAAAAPERIRVLAAAGLVVKVLSAETQ